jgi:hypothetical protein
MTSKERAENYLLNIGTHEATNVKNAFVAGWDEHAEQEMLDNIMRDSDLEVFRERAKRMPMVIRQSFQPLTDEDTKARYYLAECGNCGWWGSSRLLEGGGFLAGCDDYDDSCCPLCGASEIEDKELKNQ